MRRVLLALVVLFAFADSYAETYYWVGGTTSAALGATGTLSTSLGGTAVASFTPTSSDIIIFDGSDISSTGGNQTGTITFIHSGASYSVGQMIFQNNVTVIYNCGTGGRNITINGLSGMDFQIGAGSSFTQQGSNVTLSIATGATASISGTYNCGQGSNTHVFSVADANGATFNNGSIFRYQSNSNPFGSTNLNSVVFAAGSTYNHIAGSNPFGATAPNSVVVFQQGSKYSHQQASDPSLSGRTYANFEYNINSTRSPTGSSTLTVDNLTVIQGVLNLNLTGGITVKGDITVSGGTLTFSPASPNTITLSGISTQTISNAATFTIAANATFSITNSTSAGVVLGSSINGMNGIFSVASGGVFSTSTHTLSGSGTFNALSGSNVKIGSTAGIAASGATGNIQTTTRNFNSGANYEYNGSSAQVTGSGLPSTVNKLTINNSTGVTLTNASAVSNELILTSGALSLGANNLTLTGATVTNASSSNFIVTNSTGKVIRSISSGGGSFTFPIGRNSSTYNPVTITNTGGTNSTYTIGVNSTTYTPVADGANTQWSIAASAATTSSLAFQWLTADAGVDLQAAPSTALAYQYNGSSWQNRGGTTSGTPNVTTVAGITDLSDLLWTVALPQAVPSITLSEISTINSANIAQATANNIIYNFKLDVADNDATLTQLTIPTTGNYTSSDLTNLKLWYHTANNFGAATLIKSITPAGAGTETFSSFLQTVTIAAGATGNFWVTADVAGGATIGRTITVTPAIEESNFIFTATVNFSSGTISAGGTQTISAGTSGVTLSRISDVSAANILNNTTNNIIYNFQLAVANVAATLNQVVINTSGNYTNSDLTNLKLWYNSSNNFGTASAIKTITPSGATVETFGSLSQSIAFGATGYFWITADVEASATIGRTITVTPALSFNELTFAGATSNATGTINAGGTQTITATPAVTLSEISTVAAGNIAQATANNIIYNFRLDVADAAATISQVTIATTGTYTASDLTNLKLWYHTSNNFAGASAIKNITTSGAGTETFGGLAQSISAGSTGYFWITTDVAGSATLARTITVTPAIAQSNFSFTTPVNFTTGTINAGETQTVSAGTSAVTLNEISTVGAANIAQGSASNIIYNFRIDVADVAATLTQVSVQTTGNYTSADIPQLKLWYHSSNAFGSAITISTITPGGAGTETFGSLSRNIGIGATGYFWITADVAGNATAGRTITVTPALSFSDLTFSGATSNTTGTINTGGTQTIAVASNVADAFRTKASGNWNDATPGNIWESFTNGSWIDATLTPGTSAASITIRNTHTITVPNAASITADDVTIDVGGQITIASGGTLTIADGTATPDLMVNGYLRNSGTLTMTGTGTISGSSATYEHNLNNLTIPLFTWTAGSTLEITGIWSASSAGTTIATLSPSNTYQNVTFNYSNPTADSYISLGGITISGKLKIISTGSGAILCTTTTAPFTCNAYEQTGGILYVNRQASGDRGLIILNNADIAGGTVYLKVNATNTNNTTLGQFTIGGNLTVGSGATFINGALGAQTVSTTPPQLIFNGSSPQQWSHQGNLTNAIAIVVSGTGGVTLTDDLTLSSAGSLSLTSGNFTIAASKTLTLSSTHSIAIPSGRTLTLNGTLINSSTAITPNIGILVISSTGTYVHNTTASSGNMLSMAANGSLDAGSTWIYRGSSVINAAVSLSNRTFGNLVFESSSGSWSPTLSGTSSLTVNGSLSVGGSGGGTFNSGTGFSGTITVAGGATIVSGSTMAFAGDYIIGGDFVQNGTFTHASGKTVTFNGTTSQVYTKTGTGNFVNLTINNSNGLSLNNDLTVTGTLTFTSGNITSGSNKVILSSTGSVNGGGTGWVIGNLQKNVAAGNKVSRTFEVGGTTNYRPLNVSFANVSVAGNLVATVSTSAGDHPNIATSGIDASKSVNRYWSLTNSGITFTTYDVTMNFVSGDVDGGANTNNFIVRQYTGSSWSTSTVGTRTSTSTQASGFTSFGDFVVGETSGAPVVSVQPANSSACDGNNASFASSSASTPAPTVAWERSTDNGNNWVAVNGSTDGGIYSNFTTTTLNITGATNTINRYLYRAVFNNINGSVNSDAATLFVGYTWTGATNNDWNTATNWSCNQVPGNSDQVVIPSGGTQPAITGTITLGNVQLNTGATLDLSGSTSVTLSGAISGSGTITGSPTSSLVISDDAGTISFTQTNSGTRSLKNLTLSAGASATLGNTLEIVAGASPGEVSVGAGAVLTTGGNLILRSNANGTARILAGDKEEQHEDDYIVGNVTAERFVPSKGGRKSIFLGVPVTATVDASWQQQIYVTGPGTGGTICNPADANNPSQPGTNSNGFDASGANQGTIFTYNPANAANNRWVGIADSSTLLTPGLGYRVLVRGSRTQGCVLLTNTSTAPDAVTLSATGPVAQGNISVTLQNGFNLLSNPYPCEINFASVYANNSGSIGNKYWTFNPDNNSGTYTTWDGTDLVNGGALANPSRIASGQSFFMQSSTAGTITNFFRESQKTATTQTQTGLFRNANVTGKIRAGFKRNDGSHLDEVIIRFSDNINATTLYNDATDTRSMNEANQIISSLKGTGRLAIQTRPSITQNDTVALRITSTSQGSFKLLFSEYTSFSNVDVILLDGYSGASQIINNNPTYSFSIDANAASQGSDRFKLVFKPSTVLPVDFIALTVRGRGNGAEVMWKVSDEKNAIRYEVERSADGRSFEQKGIVQAKGNSTTEVSYSWVDNSVNGTVYYRIKGLSAAGVKYSPVVKYVSGDQNIFISLYPNPAKEVLNVMTSKQLSGTLSIRVMNSFGQAVWSRSGVSTANNIVQVNTSEFAAGMYIVEITDATGMKLSSRFVKH